MGTLAATLHSTNVPGEARAVDAAAAIEHPHLALAGVELGFWDWHIPSGRGRFNRRWCEMLGVVLDEIEHDVASWQQRVHPDDIDRVLAAWSAHVEGRTDVYETEHRLRHRDGRWIWILDRGMVIERTADGAPLRAVGTHLDISERKAAADRLRESESFNRSVLDSLTAHIAVLDADGVIVAVNAAWQHLASAYAAPGTDDRSVGRSYRDACVGVPGDLDADQAAQAWAGVVDVLARRRPDYTLEYSCRTGPAVRWFRMNVHPLPGPREGAVVAHEDITAFKANEARLVALSHRLTMADEAARRRLSAELHDRTSSNLTALRLNLELVSAALDADSQRELIHPIEDARALIDDTTSSLREIGTDMRPPLLDYAGVHAALEGYAEQFARRTGVVVDLACDDPAIRLDSEREALLFRIAQEALTNCAKHARATSVRIELALERSPVVLSVSDDGVGFDPDAVGSAGAGCGMGLLGMRSMAEVAGGRFLVAAQPGAGTRIRVEV